MADIGEEGRDEEVDEEKIEVVKQLATVPFKNFSPFYFLLLGVGVAGSMAVDALTSRARDRKNNLSQHASESSRSPNSYL